MKERVFRYGENNRGLGMITLPENTEGAPIVVMLNAGLLYRAEPYRLNVLAARALADIGYICVRVDISGKGDTPSRENLTNRESVALDWQFISRALENQFGKRNLIIFGLCSGADNGIKIAAKDQDVKGLILLDAVSKQDPGFSRRAFINKITNVSKWLNLPKNRYHRLIDKFKAKNNLLENPTGLRDEPNDNDLQLCFNNLISHDGRVLAVFTSHAMLHYNKLGQFSQALQINGLENICEEIFWPSAEHLYPVQAHREQLLQKVSEWGKSHFDRFRE